MNPILLIATVVFLYIVVSIDATLDGLFSISRMLTLVLPAFGLIYMLLTFYRVSRAAR